MFLRDLGHALLCRWYLVLVGLILTGLGVVGIQQYVPVSYKAEANVVLIPPQTAVIEGANPYLYMGALDQALSVLTVRMGSRTISEPIIGDDIDMTYTIAKDVATTGPIILIASEGPTRRDALRIVDQVLKQVPPNLKQMQDALSVPKNARITSMTIVQDQKADVVTKKQVRMMVAVAGVGLSLTILLSGWIDAMLNRFKNRRAAKRAANSDASKSSLGTENRKRRQRGSKRKKRNDDTDLGPDDAPAFRNGAAMNDLNQVDESLKPRSLIDS